MPITRRRAHPHPLTRSPAPAPAHLGVDGHVGDAVPQVRVRVVDALGPPPLLLVRRVPAPNHTHHRLTTGTGTLAGTHQHVTSRDTRDIPTAAQPPAPRGARLAHENVTLPASA